MMYGQLGANPLFLQMMAPGSWFFAALPIVLIWSLVWKGFALWFAAKREEKIWFIVFLILNTAGILELIYLVFIVKALQTKKTATKKKK